MTSQTINISARAAIRAIIIAPILAIGIYAAGIYTGIRIQSITPIKAITTSCLHDLESPLNAGALVSDFDSKDVGTPLELPDEAALPAVHAVGLALHGNAHLLRLDTMRLKFARTTHAGHLAFLDRGMNAHRFSHA